MFSTKRPYIIVPQLIEQPTWGGSYIAQYKGWDQDALLASKKIGQSYELSGASMVLMDITSTSDANFSAAQAMDSGSPAKKAAIGALLNEQPEAFVGKGVYDQYKSMPLLIKFTQALGNSFQLHRKPEQDDPYWKPKAESWYFMEKGKMTYGLSSGCDISHYRAVCEEIDDYMHSLSHKVESGELTVAQARETVSTFIQQKNPWQFVNVVTMDQYGIIDLSGGGLHHSWEEDASLPLGNIVYEVQQDVADDVSTLRSFDQGKIKDDGSVRALSIDDYFRFLDTSPERNDPGAGIRKRSGDTLFATKYYCLDKKMIEQKTTSSTDGSFVHLFVTQGQLEVTGPEGTVTVGRGHSCFIPADVGEYTLVPQGSAEVLKTYIPL